MIGLLAALVTVMYLRGYQHPSRTERRYTDYGDMIEGLVTYCHDEGCRCGYEKHDPPLPRAIVRR